MFDITFNKQEEKSWEEARRKAELELKDLPVKVCTGRKGFYGGRPTVFIDVPVRGNKELISLLQDKGWRGLRSNNVNGNRIRELEKTF